MEPAESEAPKSPRAKPKPVKGRGRPRKTTVHMNRGAKSCTVCGVVRKFRMFSALKEGLGGVHSICKRCRADAARFKRAEVKHAEED